MNGVLLGKYYRIHKKAQIINVANEVKKNNYQNIRIERISYFFYSRHMIFYR
jgi:hypothetical protein